MSEIIRAESIYKSYFIKQAVKTEVLKGISLKIYENEFAAVMGPSGAGKSTLLYLLGSLELPDSGCIEISLAGKFVDYGKIRSSALSEIRNKHIGFVFQFHHLLPEFNALENVMMPALISGCNYKTAEKKANALLDQVGITHRATHKPSELSGGEQQRAAIARALINAPTIVFADEPTGNLDLKNSRAVIELIHQLRIEHNITFVIATHSSEIAEAADRKIMMADGNIADIN